MTKAELNEVIIKTANEEGLRVAESIKSILAEKPITSAEFIGAFIQESADMSARTTMKILIDLGLITVDD